ncbi:MAG TPA: SufE family protein [Vicinamibacterales bacterium]|nr:SufE family protein [Vicinamibacterales bacterium]
MSAYPGRLDEVIDTLSIATDPADRADLLLGFADRFREVPPDVASRPFAEINRVPGCESEAYVWGVLQDEGTLRLYFAVENPSGVSAKALASILDRALSGLPPGEVAEVSPDIVYEVFRRDISMGKGLGLMSMVRAVQVVARQAAEAPRRAGGGPRLFPQPASGTGVSPVRKR